MPAADVEAWREEEEEEEVPSVLLVGRPKKLKKRLGGSLGTGGGQGSVVAATPMAVAGEDGDVQMMGDDDHVDDEF